MADLAQWLEDSYDQSFRTAMFILGNRADAEDAVQEAFLRAWRFRDSLSNEAKLRPWLYRVVVNTCRSKLRSDIPRQRRTTGPDGLEAVESSGSSPEDEAAWSEVQRVVVDALSTLPVDLRVTLVLRYYAGLSEREIAIVIGRRPGTVKSRLHEARRMISSHSRLSALAREHLLTVSEVAP